MSVVTFDTLQFVQTLKESGFDEKQAEGMTKALRNAQDQTETVTKSDQKELEMTLANEMQSMRTELKTEMQSLRAEMQVIRAEMQAAEYRMTIKLGAMLGASIALMAGIMKLMQHV
jgi:hypothetical protein